MDMPFYHEDGSHEFGHVMDNADRYLCNTTMAMTKKGFSVIAVGNGGPLFPVGGGGAVGGSASTMKLLQAHQGGHTLASSPSSSSVDRKLSSSPPNLEHPSNQGLIVTANPAPNLSHNPNSFPYRDHATHEQEGFADGFIKALADLHKQNQLLVGGGEGAGGGEREGGGRGGVLNTVKSPYPRSLMSGEEAGGRVGACEGEMPIYANLTSNYHHHHHPNNNSTLTVYQTAQLAAYRPPPRVSDLPQTVPDVPQIPSALTPPPLSSLSLSVVDPEAQERIKAERKKLRNRIAASKCRKRKLERISRLEERVKALKTQNANLVTTASTLRGQVSLLKERVLNHMTNGCQIAGVGAGAKGGGLGSRGAAAESATY